MARIDFHTPERTVEVIGFEYTRMAELTEDIALSILRPEKSHTRDLLTPLMRHTSSLEGLNGGQWAEEFRSCIKLGQIWFEIDGETIHCSHLVLNTLIAIGSPVLQLATLLHGTCSGHGFVDVEDAGVVRQPDPARSPGKHPALQPRMGISSPTGSGSGVRSHGADRHELRRWELPKPLRSRLGAIA